MPEPLPTATTLTIAEAASWLGASLIGVLLYVWRALVGRVDDHDRAIEALKLQASRSESQHGETGRVLARMQEQLDSLDAKIDDLPGRVAQLLTRGRNS